MRGEAPGELERRAVRLVHGDGQCRDRTVADRLDTKPETLWRGPSLIALAVKKSPRVNLGRWSATRVPPSGGRGERSTLNQLEGIFYIICIM